jgi:hypothetical protein
MRNTGCLQICCGDAIGGIHCAVAPKQVRHAYGDESMTLAEVRLARRTDVVRAAQLTSWRSEPRKSGGASAT